MKKYVGILVASALCQICVAQQSGPGFVNGQYHPEYHQSPPPTYTPSTPSRNSNTEPARREYSPSQGDNTPKSYTPEPKAVVLPIPENGYGEYTYTDGSKYTGGFKNSKRSGIGTLVNKSSIKYEGEWADDKYNGKGVLTIGSGEFAERYEGDFVNGVRNGKGTSSFLGTTYTGDWNYFKEGYGTMISSNGDKYTGGFVADFKSGYGTLTKANGETYVGNWAKEMKSGAGTYTYANGEKYTGNWANDKMDGAGILYDGAGRVLKQGSWDEGVFISSQPMHLLNDGSKYYGDLKDGKRNGEGICKYSNGNRYDGGWKDDLKDGQGKLVTDSSIYTGLFKNNLLEGAGKLSFNAGGEYQGNFKNDKYNGTGTRKSAAGDKYTGEWYEGKENGTGSCIYADGCKYDGGWKDGAKDGAGVLYDPTGAVLHQGSWKQGVFYDPNSAALEGMKILFKSATHKFSNAMGVVTKREKMLGDVCPTYASRLVFDAGKRATVVRTEIYEHKTFVMFEEEIIFKTKTERDDFIQQLNSILPGQPFSLYGTPVPNYAHVTLGISYYQNTHTDNNATFEVTWTK